MVIGLVISEEIIVIYSLGKHTAVLSIEFIKFIFHISRYCKFDVSNGCIMLDTSRVKLLYKSNNKKY